MPRTVHTHKTPLKIVVLLSGNGSTLQSIIDGIKAQHLPIEISAVISNRPNAKQASIPAICLEHTRFESRLTFDETLINHIDNYAPDLIILAGFMRVLSPKFVKHYAGKILNIHPSLLPKYRGLNTHARALAAKDAEHGTTVHVVTSELDEGPILAQDKFAITPDDTPETLEAKVHALEHTLYIKVINWFAEGKVEIDRTGKIKFSKH